MGQDQRWWFEADERQEIGRLRIIEKAAREFMKTATGPDVDAYIALRDALELPSGSEAGR